MATRNGENYLHEQLESILPQLAPEDELVISDDSSTDKTLEIIRTFDDAAIRLLTEQPLFQPDLQFRKRAQARQRRQSSPWPTRTTSGSPDKLALIRQKLGEKTDRPALIMLDGYIIDAAGPADRADDFRPQAAEARRAGQPLRQHLHRLHPGLHPAAAGNGPALPARHPDARFLAGDAGPAARRGSSLSETQTMEYRRHGANLSKWQRNPLVQIRWRLCLGYQLYRRQMLVKRRSQNSL